MVKAHPTFICIVFAGLLYFASSGVLSAQNATLDGSDSRLSYLPPIVEPDYAVIPPATYQPILEPPIISAPIEDPIMAVASANSIQSSIQKSIPASFYDNHLARGNDPVDQLYRENAQRPLGGLFAKGFTRTMTLLGGWNFANSIDIADPTIAAGVPAAEAIDFADGYAISFAFGRRHSHRLRSEIELALRENDLAFGSDESGRIPIVQLPTPQGPVVSDQDDRVGVYSVMKNFIFEHANDSRLTPYVGVGLGWSYLDVESTTAGIDEGVGAFSYQGIGGVATRLNKAVDFIVEYRFLGTSEVEFETVDQALVFESHNLFMGLKLEY